MSLLDRFRRTPKTQQIERFTPQLPVWPDPRYPGFGLTNGLPYSGFTMSAQPQEPVEDTYAGYVLGAYKANGVVFAVALARQLLLGEVRFKWRRYGQAGGGNDLFGTPELAVLERPWPGGTTQDLVTRMEQDATASGTAFVAREGDRLRRLRPDWVEFILTAPPAYATEVDIVGFRYTVGGPGSGGETKYYLAEDVAYWAPIPDPLALFRGMSWLTPVIRELQADQATTAHKQAFFENAATPNMVVSVPETIEPDVFKDFVQMSEEAHAGAINAGKTFYIGGGATATVVGSNFRDIDLKQVQGAGETRIAAAGRVPPIVVGLSEGLAAATYSNYNQARRAFADSWARPAWRSLCGALSNIVDIPSGAELWYDDRDIAFLREDRKDVAEILTANATAIRTLTDAGYTPASVTAAVLAEDYSLLVHTGLFSVQLQPPGSGPPAVKTPPTTPALPAEEV